jgi:transposase
MNNSWTQEELETLKELRNHNLKFIQAHFPDKKRSTIQSALDQLDDRLKNKKKLILKLRGMVKQYEIHLMKHKYLNTVIIAPMISIVSY